MLPFYVFGNLHCFGMCGPIAFYLAGSNYRIYYLIGRIFSFTLAGWAAGAMGSMIQLFLRKGPFASLFSIMIGILLCLFSLSFIGYFKPMFSFFHKLKNPLEKTLEKWMFIQEPWPFFLIGASTILLPCGQTLLVYSACALSGSGAVGMINGFGFAVITTPSLLLAMKTRKLAGKWLERTRFLLPLSFALVGALAVLRGLAEAGLISHFGIHPFMVY